jgi:hypothetical protein
MSAFADDKRDSDRIEILGDLVGEVMLFQPMAIKEISRGGAQIETAFPLQLDSLHDIRLTLGDRSIVVKGRIVHCRIAEVDHDQIVYRSGIEFTDASNGADAVVADFLEAIRSGRRAV